MSKMLDIAAILLSGTKFGDKFGRFILNRYEAAIPSTPDRPYLPAYVRDARFDATSFTRWELSRKARYFRRNSWLVKRLQDVEVKYTVGPNGLSVVPESSDHEWNKRISEAFHEWCGAPFVNSLASFGQGQRLMRCEAHIDGEVFVNCTRIKKKGTQSIPAIELIESHRCSSPGTEYDWPQEGQSNVDGVELGRDESGELTGRPIGYHLRSGVDGEKWNLFPAFSYDNPYAGGIIHLFDPDRIEMFRGISPYAPILNETADLELLAALEMDRAKQNSEDAKRS